MDDVDTFIDNLVKSDALVRRSELSDFDLFLDQFNLKGEKAVDEADEFVEHFGTKGMKWGVRKARYPGSIAPGLSDRQEKRIAKNWEGNPKKLSKDRTAYIRDRAAAKAEDLFFVNDHEPILKKHTGADGKIKNKNAYFDDAMGALQKRVDEQLRAFTPPGLDPPKLKVGLMDDNGVMHSDVIDNEKLIFDVETDENGVIVSLKLRDSLVQSDEVSGLSAQIIQYNELSEFLSHHGIKGMRWGIRRKNLATTGISGPSPKKFRKQALKGVRKLSDDQLKDYISRLETEKRLKALIKEDISPGRARVNRLLKESGDAVFKQTAKAIGAHVVGKAIGKAFNSPELGAKISGGKGGSDKKDKGSSDNKSEKSSKSDKEEKRSKPKKSKLGKKSGAFDTHETKGRFGSRSGGFTRI